MYNAACVFLRFLQRDIYVFKYRIGRYLLNYWLFYPVLYAFAIGYIQTHVYFGGNNKLGTSLLIGHILVIVFQFANTLNVGLLFDLENKRYVDFQIMLLNPHLLIIERILFTSLFTFCMVIPFYPITKLVLQDAFVTTHTSWLKTYIILYLGALCCSAYTQMAACIISSSRALRSFQMRVNFGLITLGGLFIPLYVMKKFSAVLGAIVLFNPLLHISEGLRSAILDDPVYLPVWVCISALISFSVICTLGSFYFFKRRVDHL